MTFDSSSLTLTIPCGSCGAWFHQFLSFPASPPCFGPPYLSVVGKADDPASLSERAPFCERDEWMDRTAHPMVLVVAPGDGEAEPPAEGAFPLGGLVIAVERDGGGIVVQLVECDVELADGPRGDVERQCGHVGVEEAIEAPPDAIVIRRGELFIGQSERRRFVLGGPLS